MGTHIQGQVFLNIHGPEWKQEIGRDCATQVAPFTTVALNFSDIWFTFGLRLSVFPQAYQSVQSFYSASLNKRERLTVLFLKLTPQREE